MIRRALSALLLFAVLFGLGVWALWARGWLPWQQEAGPPSPLPAAQPPAVQPPIMPPATVRLPAPVPPVIVPPAPTPAQPPEVQPAPETVTPALPVRPTVPAPLPQRPAAPAVPSRTTPPTSKSALAPLNAVRTLAALPPVIRAPGWESQCAAHARYLVKTDRGEHREEPDSPFRSAAGVACAPGHYFVSSQPTADLERAAAYWATGPFHLPQLIDPRLTRVAVGSAHDGAGRVQSAVLLDGGRGLTGIGAYPVRFPAPGRTSPFTTAAPAEWPDPLPSCSGYAGPVGAPIALLLGPGRRVTGAALKVNGRAVAACLLTPASFRGASTGDTRAGRNVLAAQGGAVLLPRRPLPPGAAVHVGFSTDRGRVGWAFHVR
ncbi:hypothetical protein E7T09_06965 [Deinococcus sp. KSM4-11]|uniref:CAP domain-containing protein n=1 Tax=Deinococcus sp. KSM4-11 TaxID=2568654 RepID=UPI0010A47AEB|nr:CAP domain-containing protein [Deinococcus sp. KSM4-11]THF88904.1 hypothetical protein E7T09_06965 [Deinococcus sp. KSM4-11]